MKKKIPASTSETFQRRMEHNSILQNLPKRGQPCEAYEKFWKIIAEKFWLNCSTFEIQKFRNLPKFSLEISIPLISDLKFLFEQKKPIAYCYRNPNSLCKSILNIAYIGCLTEIVREVKTS